ncbi:MAG: DUF4422 domain-containing protein [Clostridium sp.]|uniref:DUF4422 domain-containing protein n=1 Tax=Clostridium sp. TaxID=1506 RepID=UPI0032163BD3
MDIKILVATHKKYKMPKDNMYLPLHVGRNGKADLGYAGDNTGDNISSKNANFCELTGLYWAYKNLKCDYIGLCHYRRYFTLKSNIEIVKERNNKFSLIPSTEEIKKLMNSYDVILPKKRNYYIETVKSHYKNAHHIADMDRVENIIKEHHSEYIESFNQVMDNSKLYLYNMFIMSKSDFDNYCSWLFDILFKLEKEIDITDYDSYQSRIYGFLSERLFNVWLHKQNFKTKEISVINMENVNWYKKIKDFLKRKIASN